MRQLVTLIANFLLFIIRPFSRKKTIRKRELKRFTNKVVNSKSLNLNGNFKIKDLPEINLEYGVRTVKPSSYSPHYYIYKPHESGYIDIDKVDTSNTLTVYPHYICRKNKNKIIDTKISIVKAIIHELIYYQKYREDPDYFREFDNDCIEKHYKDIENLATRISDKFVKDNIFTILKLAI